ncbi:MAG: hypothetical protein ACYS8L_09125, partial [Planctomycetota bacterium]
MRTTPIDGLLLGTTADGSVHNLRSAAGLKSLAKELQRDQRPVSLDVVAFRQGWKRKGLTIADAALESLADSGKEGGWPVYYGHQLDDRTQEEGVGVTAWVDGEEGSRELRARIKVDGDDFRKSLARGVRPRFSIGWDHLEGTNLTCDECGEDLKGGTCL